MAGLFLLLGLYMISQAPGYGLMTPNAGAGPGMLPMLAGIGIVISALTIIFVSSREEPVELLPGTIPGREGMLRVLGILLSYAAVIIFMPTLGYSVTIFCFLVVTMWILGGRDLPLMVAVSLAFSFGVFYVFTELLKVVLPRGILGM